MEQKHFFYLDKYFLRRGNLVIWEVMIHEGNKKGASCTHTSHFLAAATTTPIPSFFILPISLSLSIKSRTPTSSLKVLSLSAITATISRERNQKPPFSCTKMGSEAPDYDSQIYSPSKLSLLISRPIKPPETPPPPPRTAVSIPFQWEEAPGKPRPYYTESEPKSTESTTRKALELPPRLLFSDSKVSNLPSPTTVLDGPYVGRAMSFTTSYRSPRLVGKDTWNGNFGSSRWSGFRKNREDFEGSFDFSTSSVLDEPAFHGDTTTKAKIAKVRRRTHLWVSHFYYYKISLYCFS